MSDNSKLNDFLNEMSDVKKIRQDKFISQASSSNHFNASYRQKVAQSFGARDNNFLTDGDVEAVEPDEILNFKIDGVQPAVFKKLRQGKYRLDYHLDLHRKTVAEARKEVYALLANSARFDFRTLLITHGKGAQSNPPARLKSYINHWLKQVDMVLAFHSADARHGGVGSVYVLLKKAAKPDEINQAKYD